MTTNILNDLLPDYDELIQEEARTGRSKFNENPLHWRGKLASISLGEETFNDGRVFPRVAFNFENCRFLDVGPNSMGVYTDGESFTLLVKTHEEQIAQRFRPGNTSMAQTTKASGQKLDKFIGQEVDVVEIAEPFMNKRGYQDFGYHWKFTAVPGSNGAKPAAEIPPEVTEAALAVIATGTYTPNNVGMALLRDRSCNQNTTLNGKFGDGSWLKEMFDVGRVELNDDNVLVVTNP